MLTEMQQKYINLHSHQKIRYFVHYISNLRGEQPNVHNCLTLNYRSICQIIDINLESIFDNFVTNSGGLFSRP